jgi:hypothetical protein
VFNSGVVAVQDRSRELSLEALEELSLVTGLMKQLSHAEPSEAAAILGHHHARLQGCMIALLGKFSERDSWLGRAKYTVSTSADREEIEGHVQHIIANLVAYCRSIMTNDASRSHLKQGWNFRIVLGPSLARASEDVSHTTATGRVPALGCLLRHLELALGSYNVSGRG